MAHKKRNSPSLFIALSLVLFTFGSPLIATPVAFSDDSTTQDPLIQVKPEGLNRTVPAIADELIVKYKDDTTVAEKKEFRNDNELTTEKLKRDPLKKEDIEIVTLPEDTTAKTVDKLIDQLNNDPNVEYVEPNYLMGIQEAVSGERLAVSETQNQITNYQLRITNLEKQWPLPKLHAPAAWKQTTGNEKTVIAILDTGLDFTNSDKPQHLLPGYDFVNDDTDPQDDHGHGTFIAGLIAAPHNELGIAGLCPDCSILPVKVMDGRGVGNYADVAKGIVWAADHGAKIINLSIGGYAYSQALQDAVIYAQGKGALIVAAGGNQGFSDPLYPAAYEGVIGVSATDKDDQLWTRSNHGDSIDLAAPGVDVWGPVLNNLYKSQTGTSMAAGEVSGVAGLLSSVIPESTSGIQTPALLTAELYRNTEDLGITGRDPLFGVGRVGFKTASPEPTPQPQPEPQPTPEPEPDPEKKGLIEEVKAKDKEDSKKNPIPKPKDSATLDYMIQQIYRMSFAGGKGSGLDFLAGYNIDDFLKTQPGILKDYTDYAQEGTLFSAGGLIDQSNPGYLFDEMNTGSINERVLLVLLELKAQAITNPNLTKKDLDHIFGFDQKQLDDAARNIAGADGVPLSAKDFQYFHDNQPPFAWQIAYLVRKFSDGGSPLKDGIFNFKDGSSVKIPHNNNEAFSFRVVLAELADSRAQWEHWLSFEEGSFYDLYDKWFGWPVWLMEESSQDKIEPKKVDFLKSPYNKNDRNNYCGIGSFFDHESPVYIHEKTNEVGNTILFTGKKLIEGIVGYSNYSGHNGVDSYPRECNYVLKKGETTGDIPGAEVKAAAEGKVVGKEINNTAEGYGNYVELAHDVEGDGHVDYITRYGHFAPDSHNHIGEPLKPGQVGPPQFVPALGKIGTAGNTGASTGTHLHFSVIGVTYNKDRTVFDDRIQTAAIDPLGWWGDKEDTLIDPWQQKHSTSKSAFLFETSSYVDDTSDAFFDFNRQGSYTNDPLRWIPKDSADENKMKGGRALYRYTAHKPSRTWDNWAFWGGKVEKSVKHRVEAFIPNYEIDGKEVTKQAIYRVYHEDSTGALTYDDVTISQKDNLGKWVDLGTYDFTEGVNKAGVRLIDEVTEESEKNKVIWADAVRWVDPAGALPEEEKSSLSLTKDNTNSFVETIKKLGTQFYNYIFKVKVKNEGKKTSVATTICFQDNGIKTLSADSTVAAATDGLCRGATSVPPLAPGEEREVTISFQTQNPLAGLSAGSTADVGTVKINTPGQKKVEQPVKASDIKKASVRPGGVDFSFAEMGGISVDPASGQIRFILKGTEARSGDPVIDLSATQSNISKIFLQALAIPNSKQHISLDVISDASGRFQGSVRVPSPFEKTDAADAFLKADVGMKFDLKNFIS